MHYNITMFRQIHINSHPFTTVGLSLETCLKTGLKTSKPMIAPCMDY